MTGYKGMVEMNKYALMSLYFKHLPLLLKFFFDNILSLLFEKHEFKLDHFSHSPKLILAKFDFFLYSPK